MSKCDSSLRVLTLQICYTLPDCPSRHYWRDYPRGEGPPDDGQFVDQRTGFRTELGRKEAGQGAGQTEAAL